MKTREIFNYNILNINKNRLLLLNKYKLYKRFYIINHN